MFYSFYLINSIQSPDYIYIPPEIQIIKIQLRLLVCSSVAYLDILLGHDSMLALGMWQDYPREMLYIKLYIKLPFHSELMKI